MPIVTTYCEDMVCVKNKICIKDINIKLTSEFPSDPLPPPMGFWPLCP